MEGYDDVRFGDGFALLEINAAEYAKSSCHNYNNDDESIISIVLLKMNIE